MPRCSAIRLGAAGCRCWRRLSEATHLAIFLGQHDLQFACATDAQVVDGVGELEIVLTEEDGQVRRFTQPYANIDNLLRPGVWRYSAALGRYHPAGDLDTPTLWQGTLAYGTPWHTTLYGGLMVSEGYLAHAVGVAVTWQLGAAGCRCWRRVE